MYQRLRADWHALERRDWEAVAMLYTTVGWLLAATLGPAWLWVYGGCTVLGVQAGILHRWHAQNQQDTS